MYGFENAALGMEDGWFEMNPMWIIAILLFVVVMHILTSRSNSQPLETSIRIPDTRYGSGEVGRDGYMTRLDDLNNLPMRQAENGPRKSRRSRFLLSARS